MRAHEFKALLEKFSRGECTPQEEKLINDWYENIQSTDQSEISPEQKLVIEERIWSKVNPHPPAVPTDRQADKKPTVWYYAVAAAVLIAGFIFITTQLLNNKAEVEQTAEKSPAPAVEETQERITNTSPSPTSVTLADGSKITLEPNSEIKFSRKFDEPLREVYLSGEAFFDVSRDEKRPFRVYSEEVVTQVLGTSFTVKAYVNDKEVTVAVRSGKVSVQAPEKTLILAPNQQAVYNRTEDKVVKEVVEHPAIVLPKSNLFRMSFDEAPVEKIFEVLQENYGIDIVYDKAIVAECTLTTAMSDEGLFERIEVICKAIKATYEIKDGVIFITSPGCKQ